LRTRARRFFYPNLFIQKLLKLIQAYAGDELDNFVFGELFEIEGIFLDNFIGFVSTASFAQNDAAYSGILSPGANKFAQLDIFIQIFSMSSQCLIEFFERFDVS
jgi:hypothetical protein